MPSLDEFDRFCALLPKLTEAEQNDLKNWEREHVTGDGSSSSSDWPGWAAVINRLQN